MRRRTRVLAVVLVAVCGMAVWPPVAAGTAAGWPLPTAAPVVLGFGEGYATPDGAVATHRGVDLAAPEGSAVLAVLEGTVTFAGRIPAGEGATTLAVTVESGDVRLSYSPLASVSVEVGTAVAPGRPLGSLAGSGDRSHAEPHLHLSARRGSLYVDPTAFLLAPAVAPEPAPVPAPELAGFPVPQPGLPAAASAVSAEPVAASSPAGLAARVPAGVVAGAVVPGTVPTDARSAAPQQATPRPVTAAAEPVTAHAAQTSAEKPLAATTPAPALRAVSALPAPAGLPSPAAAALATDRRAAMAESTALPVGGLAALAAVLAALFLWPLWRAVPSLAVAAMPERQDVAAVVAR